MSSSDFIMKLRDNEVQIDDKLSTLIKKQEAGDTQSYVAFGAHIFKKLNGSETYNRIDKPGYNNIKIMGVEKVSNPFSVVDEMQNKKRKAVDNDRIEEEQRNVGGVYVPKRGGNGAKGANQMRSNLSMVLNQEQARRDAGIKDYLNTFKSVNNKERKTNITFNMGEQAADETRKPKRPNEMHRCTMTNGNIIA